MNISRLETMEINLLFSIVNMKLRNDFADLEDLCLSMGVDKSELQQRMINEGYCYSPNLKRFYRC